MPPAPAAVFILFVPLYGGGGSGEYVRAVSLAEAARQRWPHARIEFLLPGGPGTRQDVPFPKTCHDGPAPDKGAFDREHLTRLKPDVAIFDSGCRSTTLRLCKRLGIKSVYISDRAGTRRKPFRLDWLRLVDQHWHQREHVTVPGFTSRQRLVSHLSKTRRIVFDTCLPTDVADWHDLSSALREKLGRPFVLLTPGGGGYRIDGRAVGEIYLDTADRIHAQTGIECLTLLGPLYEGTPPPSVTISLRAVVPTLLVALLRRATAVVTNGGQGVHQALACGAACVLAPLGGSDQPERIAVYADAGLVVSSMPTVNALADATVGLLTDSTAMQSLCSRVNRIQVVDGMPLMLDALEQLLAAGASRH